MKTIDSELSRRVVVIGSVIYLVSYAFLMIRIFVFDRNLGYGLGDLVYLALFTIVSVLAVAVLLLSRVTKTTWLAWGIGFVTTGSAAYIWLMIYVFHGSEIS